MFSNTSDLMKFIQKNVKQSAEKDLNRIVYDTIKEFLLLKIYSNHPSSYERTYEVLNSLTIGKTKETGSGIECEIYFDTDKIHAVETEGDTWNQHMSFDGTDYSEKVVWVLEDGTDGGKYPREPGHFVKDSYEKLNSGELLNRMKGYLRTKGIVCK